jgi:hypothetical protein
MYYADGQEAQLGDHQKGVGHLKRYLSWPIVVLCLFPSTTIYFLRVPELHPWKTKCPYCIRTIEPLFCGYGYLMSAPMCVIGDQDEVLRRAVQWHKGKNWKKIGKLS